MGKKSAEGQSRGLTVALEDEPVHLVAFGPSATIQRTRSAIERFVDWDLSTDALSALQRAGQADEGG